MKKSNLCVFVLFFGLSTSSCGTFSDSNSTTSKSHEEKKLSLKETEESSPLQFLSTQGTYRTNLIGEWVIEGTVTNSASVATFKDVVLTLRYYSKTGSQIASENKILYEFFKPGETQSFKIKVDGYQGTESVGWDIKSAEPTN